MKTRNKNLSLIVWFKYIFEVRFTLTAVGRAVNVVYQPPFKPAVTVEGVDTP